MKLINHLQAAALITFAASLALANAATAPAASASKSAEVAPAISVQSVFVNNMPNGRDPFYPRSNRRAVVASAAVASAASVDSSRLLLQGLSHDSQRPIATINNRSFQPGEEGEVITTAGRMRIRCEAIGVDSVTVSIGSQRFDLQLKNKK